MKNKKRLLVYFGLIILLIAVPFTVIIFQNQQKLRSEAGQYEIPECIVEADIVLLIDTSTSMHQSLPDNTKIEAAKQSARSFISYLDLDPGDGTYDRVAIVNFGRENQTTTLQTLSNNRQTLDDAINRLTAPPASPENFGTRIDVGLTKSLSVLTADLPQRPKFVILLSDGAMDFSNEHPELVGRERELLLNSANSVKNANIKIFGIFLGSEEDRTQYNADSYMRETVSEPASDHYFTAENSNELATQFRDISRLIDDCPCPFENVAQIRDINNQVLVNQSGYRTINELGQTKDFPTTGETTYHIQATQLEESALRSATVILDRIPAGWVVDSTFCYNNDPSVPNGCPTTNFQQGNEARNTPDNPTRSSIAGLEVICNANYTYGWRVKPNTIQCTLDTLTQIKVRENSVDTLLTQNDQFKTLGYINGQPSGTENTIYNATSQKAEYPVYVPALSLEHQTATDIKVVLTAMDPQYRIVDTFCTNNANPTNPQEGCFTSTSADKKELIGFDLDCYYNLTYGWVVEKVGGTTNQPPICLLTSSNIIVELGKVTATLDGSGSSDPEGDPLIFDWTFSDGYSPPNDNTVNSPSSITHTFTQSNATVDLRVCDPQNACSTNPCQVTLPPIGGPDLPPLCLIETIPDNLLDVNAPLQAQFDGSKSYDPEGSVLLFSWRFSDTPSAPEVTTALAERTFNDPVTGVATLTVKENKANGQTMTCEKPYRIIGGATKSDPICVISSDPPSPINGQVPPELTANYFSTGSNDPDGGELVYAWYFSDNPSLHFAPDATQISRTFDAPTQGTVTLEVTDDEGVSKTCTAPYTITTGQQIEKTAICLDNYCAQVYSADPRIRDCEHPYDGDYCRCDPNLDPNIVCRQPPDTGVEGATVALASMLLIIVLAGIRLLF